MLVTVAQAFEANLSLITVYFQVEHDQHQQLDSTLPMSWEVFFVVPTNLDWKSPGTTELRCVSKNTSRWWLQIPVVFTPEFDLCLSFNSVVNVGICR